MLDIAKPLAFDRKKLMRDIERDEKRKARALLAELRTLLKDARDKRKVSIRQARERCRSHRLETRERLRAHRLQVLADLRATLKAEREAARAQCSARLDEARSIKDEIERSKAKVDAERKYQREMRVIERNHRARTKDAPTSTARERQGESDDAVRANIPADLVPLFERVKRMIKVKPGERRTRTEAFLEYAEEHPEEVLEVIEEEATRKLAELEKREHAAAKELERLAKRERTGTAGRGARLPRAPAAELAAVPF